MVIGKPRRRPISISTAYNTNDVIPIVAAVANVGSHIFRNNKSYYNRHYKRSSTKKSWLLFSTDNTQRQYVWSKANVFLVVTIVPLLFLFGYLIKYSQYSNDGYDTTYEHRQATAHTRNSNSIVALIVNTNFTVVFPVQQQLLQQQQQLQLKSSQSIMFPVNDGHVLLDHKRKKPDYGGLKIKFLKKESFQSTGRVIAYDAYLDTDYNELWEASDDDGDMESYYAFDDDVQRNPMNMYDDDSIHLQKHCRRTNWYREQPISCNTLQEYDFYHDTIHGNTIFAGSGYYRDVFLSTISQYNDSFVIKMLHWDYNFTYDDYEYIRMEAVINDKLNVHDEIVHSYAFCGTTIIGQAMLIGNLQQLAIPSGIGRSIEFNDTSINHEGNELIVRNQLSGTVKLEWSLQMAKAVRLLHSYPGGVIIHDDIQLPQFLISPNGTLQLNDFNRAEIMLWNEKDQEYCKYRNYPGWGDWRAPEEYFDKPLDEKIDIWSLGNNMYSLLTGVYPFADTEDEDEVQQMVKDGLTPYIDPRYRDRSFAESKLVDIIPKCWTYEPNQRIDIFELVTILENAILENNRLFRTT